MCGIRRQILVVLIATAFVANSAAYQACMAAHLKISGAAGDAVPQHAHAVSHDTPSVSHEHHSTPSHQHASHDPAPQAVDDHACLKCCSLCTVSGVMLVDVDRAVIFVASPITFRFGGSPLVGRTVAIDPGIPKRVV